MEKTFNVYEVCSWDEIFYTNGTSIRVAPCVLFMTSHFKTVEKEEEREIIDFHRPKALTATLKKLNDISSSLLILPIEKIEQVTCYNKIDLSLLDEGILVDMAMMFGTDSERSEFIKYCSKKGYVS